MDRRSWMRAWTLSFVVLGGAQLGCNDAATNGATDASTTAGSDASATHAGDATATHVTDATGTDATHTTAGNEVTNVTPDSVQPQTCDTNGFTSISQTFKRDKDFAHLTAPDSPNGPYDAISIEIYQGADYTGGATGPGTYSLEGSNYSTCANCVVIHSGCGPSGCDRDYYADSGNLVITEWDAASAHFRGYLDGVIAREVKIDSGTYVSTPVEGGKTWCLGGFTFDSGVIPLPVSNKTQPECVAEGTGNLLHDNVKEVALKNCNGDTVSLHATCGDSRKAMWLIGTTGWCTACHEFMLNFAQKNGGTTTREAINATQPGLDMLVFLAEDGDGNPPTEKYCKDYAADNKVDPAMVLIDSSTPAVQIELIDESGSYIETNGLGTIWQAVNPYLTADASGSVQTAYPWWALLRNHNMEYIWSDFASPDVDFNDALGGLLSGN